MIDNQAFIRLHAHDDVNTLALQASKYPDIDMPFVIQQIAGRKSVADKIPSWFNHPDILYPKHLSLEQCSSEATARYKSTLVHGQSLIDLTGGFGIDCAFLAPSFSRVTYVELNAALCEIASHNFPSLNLPYIKVVCDDAASYLNQIEQVDCVFLDPARRNESGGKTIAVSDCEPDVGLLAPSLLHKANQVMIKLSPMLDIALALQALPQTTQVYVVSVHNDCKELILILENKPVDEILITCVNLKKDESQSFVFTRKEEHNADCIYTSQIETYLYEPNSALLKAGAYKTIAARFGLKKLHPNTHLYTSEDRCDEFPGRIFLCKQVFSLNKQEIKTALSGVKQANVSVRNFPSSVADLRKRLNLADGGDAYLFAATLADDRKVLVKCVKG